MGYTSIRIEVLQRQTLLPQLQQSLKLLSMNSMQLHEYLTEFRTGNVMLVMDDDTTEERAGFLSYAQGTGFSGGSSVISTTDPASWNIPQADTLFRFLFEQLNIVRMSRAEINAAKLIIRNLDDDGYLRIPLAELGASFQLPSGVLSAAFQQVRELDPPGVGATSLSDCLALQLQRKQLTDPTLYAIVESHLPDVAAKRYGVIAKRLHISEACVRACCDTIRMLNPKPLSFCPDTPAVIPDVIVEREATTLKVQVNDFCCPKLQIDPEYAGFTNEEAEAHAFLHQQLVDARNVINAVQMRRSTLLQLAERIVCEQTPFFLTGGPLNPYTRSMAASALSVHESTISRAVQGKMLRCEWGLYPLSGFFSQKVGDHASVDMVKQYIRSFINQEPVLSDGALAERLSAIGIPVARRTVAKYRESMNIPPCSQRIRE